MAAMWVDDLILRVEKVELQVPDGGFTSWTSQSPLAHQNSQSRNGAFIDDRSHDK